MNFGQRDHRKPEPKPAPTPAEVEKILENSPKEELTIQQWIDQMEEVVAGLLKTLAIYHEGMEAVIKRLEYVEAKLADHDLPRETVEDAARKKGRGLYLGYEVGWRGR
jgi:hypothetical protein